MYLIHITKAMLKEKDRWLVDVKVYGVNPRTLFNRIIKNKLIAQWVWPGVFNGLKFKLNSDDSFFSKIKKINFIFELDNQKIPGNQINVIQDLSQFNLRLSQLTLGSKIENKLDITLNKKFSLSSYKII